MKRLIIVVSICFVIIPNIIPQTNTPIKFLDFEWGDSKQKVKNVMLKREGVTSNALSELENELFLQGGKFANLNVKSWIFGFNKNQLALATVFFDGGTMDNVEYLIDELNKKYGQYDNYKKEELKYEITWCEFDDNNDVKNGIILTIVFDAITSSKNIILLYSNNSLMGKYQNKIESKKEGEKQKGIDEL